MWLKHLMVLHSDFKLLLRIVARLSLLQWLSLVGQRFLNMCILIPFLAQVVFFSDHDNLKIRYPNTFRLFRVSTDRSSADAFGYVMMNYCSTFAIIIMESSTYWGKTWAWPRQGQERGSHANPRPDSWYDSSVFGGGRTVIRMKIRHQAAIVAAGGLG